METPPELRYTEEHEWVRIGDDGEVRVGITDYAQDALDEVVYATLPEVGAEFEAGSPMAELESHKSVAEVYAPVSGVITAVNDALNEDPSLINRHPYGAGWLVDMRASKAEELDRLLDAAAYEALLD